MKPNNSMLHVNCNKNTASFQSIQLDRCCKENTSIHPGVCVKSLLDVVCHILTWCLYSVFNVNHTIVTPRTCTCTGQHHVQVPLVSTNTLPWHLHFIKHTGGAGRSCDFMVNVRHNNDKGIHTTSRSRVLHSLFDLRRVLREVQVCTVHMYV